MDLKPGSIFVVGNKIMGVCNKCRRLVRVDKPIIGSLHFCKLDD